LRLGKGVYAYSFNDRFIHIYCQGKRKQKLIHCKG